MFPFYTPWIHLKTFGYKMGTSARGGLNKIRSICMSQKFCVKCFLLGQLLNQLFATETIARTYLGPFQVSTMEHLKEKSW